MEHELGHILASLKDAFEFMNEHVAVLRRCLTNQLNHIDVFFVQFTHGILVLSNAENLMYNEKHQLLLILLTHNTVLLLLDWRNVCPIKVRDARRWFS